MTTGIENAPLEKGTQSELFDHLRQQLDSATVTIKNLRGEQTQDTRAHAIHPPPPLPSYCVSKFEFIK